MRKLKIGQCVRITGGMSEFVGKEGTVIDTQMDGRLVLYRVLLDTPIYVPGVGNVKDDLWSRDYLRSVNSGGRQSAWSDAYTRERA